MSRYHHHRLAAVLVGSAFAVSVLAGCDTQGANSDCSTNACTVTFDRGTDAKVNILGAEVKLLKSEGDKITLEVAGKQADLTVGQQVDVAGLTVSVQSANSNKVVVKIERGGN